METGRALRRPGEIWWRRGRVELPVQERLPGIYYKLSRLIKSCLIDLNRRSSTRPVDVSFAPLIDVGAAAPRLNVTQSRPVEVRPGWMCYLLIRQQLKLHHRQLIFVT